MQRLSLGQFKPLTLRDRGEQQNGLHHRQIGADAGAGAVSKGEVRTPRQILRAWLIPARGTASDAGPFCLSSRV